MHKYFLIKEITGYGFSMVLRVYFRSLDLV